MLQNGICYGFEKICDKKRIEMDDDGLLDYCLDCQKKVDSKLVVDATNYDQMVKTLLKDINGPLPQSVWSQIQHPKVVDQIKRLLQDDQEALEVVSAQDLVFYDTEHNRQKSKSPLHTREYCFHRGLEEELHIIIDPSFCVYTRKREDMCFLVNGEQLSLHETCTRIKGLIDGRILCSYGNPDKIRLLSLFSLAGQQTTAKFVDFFQMVADKIIVASVIGGFPRIGMRI